MNTLIVYDSKHGIVEECVKLIESTLSGAVTSYKFGTPLPVPDLDAYDSVVIGGSIHAGSLQKSVKDFCEKEIPRLRNKQVGIFLCSMTPPDKAFGYFSQFPAEVVCSAAVKECFGGAVRYETMNFLEAFIMKRIMKSKENVEGIDRTRIDSFVKAFQAK
jgi:menaquinone-dependent protoporphyrinogen oxidase